MPLGGSQPSSVSLLHQVLDDPGDSGFGHPRSEAGITPDDPGHACHIVFFAIANHIPSVLP